MADPTIQTFCCHHVTMMNTMNGKNENKAAMLLQQLNSDIYNTVCIVSATVGILGAIYQIMPKEPLSPRQHRLVPTNRGRQIVVWLAVADLMASLGVFIRSVLWLTMDKHMPYGKNDTYNVVFCALSSAWTQYFYMCTWLWTLVYAVDVHRSLQYKAASFKVYHAACWTLPALLTLMGLLLLYLPDADCHSVMKFRTVLLRILPNYCATYMLIALVMIVNPILYSWSSKDAQNVFAVASGQVTSRERMFADALRLKFSSINLVFYMCWLPNLINGVLLWTLWWHLPVGVIITLWYIMAVTNPLQALMNALVYRRWRNGERLKLPCRRSTFSVDTNGSPMSTPEGDEHTPLIPKSRTRTSINSNRCSYM